MLNATVQNDQRCVLVTYLRQFCDFEANLNIKIKN